MGATANAYERKTWKESLFGGSLKSGRGWSLVALRVALGFMFLYGGYEKIITELGGNMATKGFLAHVAGPLAGVFTSMSGNPAVEYLLVYGELLVGLSLVLGVVTRVGGVSGFLISILLYLSTLPAMPATYTGGYLNYLLTHNALINEYIIFALVFVAFVFLVPGRFFGIDGILQNSGFVQRRPILARLSKVLG